MSIKSLARSVLHVVGLLDAARHLRRRYILLSPRRWYADRQFRRGFSGAYPLPPSSLIYLVTSGLSAESYWQQGQELMQLLRDDLQDAGVASEDLNAVLDFGCGCGRLLRHIPTVLLADHPRAEAVKIHGCDYNPTLAEWCRTNLTFAEIYRNDLAPPLPYNDGSLDLIYMRSVFTHLTESMRVRWLAEFARVLVPGGVLYLTTLGSAVRASLSAEEQAVYEQGRMIVREEKREGENACLAMHPLDYFEKHPPEGYEVVAAREAEGRKHRQDRHLLRRRARSAVQV